jgi:hypothetical protein
MNENPFKKPTVSGYALQEDIKYFVFEREAIRKRKEQGLAPPWTDDELLSRYRFCNVRRKDDRVSRWLLKHIFSTPRKDEWLVALICRAINWPPALERIAKHGGIPQNAESWDPEIFEVVLENMKAEGLKLYTGAYMVYAGKEKDLIRSTAISKNIISPAVQRTEFMRAAVANNTVEGVVTELCKVYGISTFLAGQVAADLTYLPNQLDKATDLYTYAPQGPGSLRGLNRLFRFNKMSGWSKEMFQSTLSNLRKELIADIPELEDTTLHDIQNVMCEMDKYWRTLKREGRTRSNYKPETAYEV